MADDPESKTEQATPKRLEESLNKGQFARSAEINTLFSILTTLVILKWMGPHLWDSLSFQFRGLLTAIPHDLMSADTVVTGALSAALRLVGFAAPALGMAIVSGVIASGLQSRFHFTPGALNLNWSRLNPLEGIQQLIKPGMLVRTGVKLLNLAVILLVAWGLVWNLVNHPVFLTDSGLDELLRFMGGSVEMLLGRLLFGLSLIVAADYGYQVWKTSRELRMSKQEVKEESRSNEGDPESKARMKRAQRKMRMSWRMTVPTADVVVTNPTHISVALKFDATVDKAPRVVAKGQDFNALRIREIAKEFQVPLVENKPVARLLFQICEEGDAIDPRVYQAVAEILAFVYRTNRHRYYLGKNNTSNG